MSLIDTKVSGEREGRFTSAIESQTAKVPSAGYLIAAIGSMAVSAGLKSREKITGHYLLDSGLPASCSSASTTKLSSNTDRMFTAELPNHHVAQTLNKASPTTRRVSRKSILPRAGRWMSLAGWSRSDRVQKSPAQEIAPHSCAGDNSDSQQGR